jgi:cell division protein FtsQ
MNRKNKIKKKVKVREKRISLGPFKILGLTLVLMLGGFFAIASAYLTTEGIKRVKSSPYFYVKSLKINGTKVVPESKIIAIIKNGRESLNIFDVNPVRVRNELLKEGWIKDAVVQRIFPDTIHVEVQERVPIARIHLAEGEYLVDEDGIVFSKSSREFQNLPLLLGEFNRQDLSSVKKVIDEYTGVSNSYPKEIVFDASTIRITDLSGILVTLDREDLGNMKYVKWAFNYIRNKGISPRAIDMSYPQKAVLQF